MFFFLPLQIVDCFIEFYPIKMNLDQTHIAGPVCCMDSKIGTSVEVTRNICFIKMKL